MMAGPTHFQLERPTFDTPPKVALVVAPYYREIADNLLAGARAELEAAGAEHETFAVPGALEIPSAIALIDRKGDFDACVALGCVIRGETTHYDTVCNDSSRGLTMLGLAGVAVGNGILTVETYEQAQVRADPKGQNKGGGAAAAALHLVALSRRLGQRGKPIGFVSQ